VRVVFRAGSGGNASPVERPTPPARSAAITRVESRVPSKFARFAPRRKAPVTSRIKASLRRRMIGPVAMAFAALLAISGTVPANAVTPAPASAAGSESSIGGPVQSLEVSGTAATTSNQRGGYTSAIIPKPKPKPKPKPAPKPAAQVQAAAAGASVQVWTLPTSGRISSAFGPRAAPVAGVSPFHDGADIVAQCGQPVRAAQSGTVIESGFQGSYGNWILIDHGNGIQTGYAHSSENLAGKGQSVAAGAVIARVGSTGASTGCHVHFETRVGGTQVDPQQFMNSHGVSLG